jgi:hypothetical protein
MRKKSLNYLKFGYSLLKECLKNKNEILYVFKFGYFLKTCLNLSENVLENKTSMVKKLIVFID